MHLLQPQSLQGTRYYINVARREGRGGKWRKKGAEKQREWRGRLFKEESVEKDWKWFKLCFIYRAAKSQSLSVFTITSVCVCVCVCVYVCGCWPVCTTNFYLNSFNFYWNLFKLLDSKYFLFNILFYLALFSPAYYFLKATRMLPILCKWKSVNLITQSCPRGPLNHQTSNGKIWRVLVYLIIHVSVPRI